MLFMLAGVGLFVLALILGGVWMLLASDKKLVGAILLLIGLMICGGIAAMIMFLKTAEGL
jgi:hypothetical protein